MNAQQPRIGRKTLHGPVPTQLLWVALGLALTAALAITAITQLAPAPTAAKPAVSAQSVPDANTKAVMDYLRAHGYGQPSTAQSVPDANTKAVMDYLRAHGVGQPAADWSNYAPPELAGQSIDQSYFLQLFPAQAVPDPNTKAVLDYLSAHGVVVDRSFHMPAMSDYGHGAPTGQTVPDAIAQSYFLQLFPSQTVPDPNAKAVMDYLRAHGVAAAGSIQSTHLPR